MENCHHNPFSYESFLMSYKRSSFRHRTQVHGKGESGVWSPDIYTLVQRSRRRGVPENFASSIRAVKVNPAATSNHTLLGTVTALQRTEERPLGEITSARGYIHILATVQTDKLQEKNQSCETTEQT